MNFRRLKIARLVVGLCITAALMTGCAPWQYRSAFYDYSDVYADSQNHQMLLNLARLSQHDPPYFFQSGNIQANYTFTGSFNAQAGQTVGNTLIKPYNWLWNNLQLQGTRTSQPSFNFVPLVGGEFAAHLITPINPNVFDSFFQEGFPVDILMRSLIQQVQFTLGTNTVTLNNIPTPQNVENYAEFLRLCDMLRDLQERGFLQLAQRQAGTNTFEHVGSFDKVPDPKEIFDSTAQGYHWSEDKDGTWDVDREVHKTNALEFQITIEGEQYLQGNCKPGLPPPYNHPEQVQRLMYILAPDSPVVAKAPLRSFFFTLEDTATEQAAFENLMSKCGNCMTNEVPARQLRPVLRLTWKGEGEKVSPSLIAVDYHGTMYKIADPPEEWSNGYNSYNRDAFLLDCTLFSQISLDPTTLNYQQQYILSR